MSGLAWMIVLGLVGAAALAAVLLLSRARARRGRAGALAHQARQLKLFGAEARADLLRRLTDDQDLDRWQAEYEDWCRRVGERLARHFPAQDRAMFDAEHEPPLGTLAYSRTPRRDACRLVLSEKLQRLDAVIERHLGGT